ncbi:Alpha-mannosidase OS=Streptomyces albaduncus OX=68172 GN=FHS32_002500 PE=3 SV=1 [Streptomyces griseoloalbus]
MDSVLDLATGRETIAPGRTGNLLQLHQDLPNMWDAWDVDEFYRNTVTDLTDADEVTPGDDGASVRIVRTLGGWVTRLRCAGRGGRRA